MEVFATVLELSGAFFDRLEVDFSSDYRDGSTVQFHTVRES